jgi:hypothetical protein
MTYGWLRLMVSRPALMIMAALGGAVALGLAQRACAPPPPPAVGGITPESPRTEPAKDVRDAPEERTPPPPQIIVIRPGERDRARIAGEIQRPDMAREFTEESIDAARRLGVITEEEAAAALASYRAEQERLARDNRDLKEKLIQFERELVARRTIPPAPWGGTATATTSRVTGRTDVDFVRAPRPRVNWLWDFGVGARYTWSDAEVTSTTGEPIEADTSAQTVDAHLFAEPVEFGRRFPTVLRLEAAYEKSIEGDLELKGMKYSVTMDTHFNRDRRVRRRMTQEEQP